MKREFKGKGYEDKGDIAPFYLVSEVVATKPS